MSFSSGYRTLVAFCAVSCWSAGLKAQTASYTDLGNPPGESFSCATSINSSGQIAGSAFTSNFSAHAFFRPANGGMIDIGTLGGSTSGARQISASGQVVGSSTIASGSNHAFVWDTARGMTDLGLLPGDIVSLANRINAAGLIIGESAGNSNEAAVLWKPDQSGTYHISDLGSFGGTITLAEAINASGQVVGASRTANGSFRAFLWQEGQGLTDLGNLPGGDGQQTSAFAINDAGQVVGQSATTGGQFHAFLWQAGKGMTDLGTLPGGRISIATGINARGEIIGTSTTGLSLHMHSVLWQQDDTGSYQPTDLGTIKSFVPDRPIAINNAGQIIGTLNNSNSAFLWQDGEITDLFDLIPPNPLFIESDFGASDINDAGQIVGCGGPNNRAWLLQVLSCGRPSLPRGSFPDALNPALLDFGNGWKATIQVTDQDGLKASDVFLNQRYMAVSMSLPYYTLETTAFPEQRCELEPDTGSFPCNSRLVDFKQPGDFPPDSEKQVVEATYEVDNISTNPNSCLLLTQRYEFWTPVDPTTNPSKACEPSDNLLCARFKPIVKYRFSSGGSAEQLNKINTAQRLHFAPDLSNPAFANVSASSSTFFHDCNTSELFKVLLLDLTCFPTIEAPGSLLRGSPLFTRDGENPSTVEFADQAILGGLPATWDNIHQTRLGKVVLPAGVIAKSDFATFLETGNPLDFRLRLVPGCPECVHIHWRWSDVFQRGVLGDLLALLTGTPLFGAQFGQGKPLIPPGSDQSVEIAVVRFHPGEEHPFGFHLLIDNPPESLIGQPQVFWYSATSSRQSDEFFAHGGFFAPELDTPVGTNVTSRPVDATTAISLITILFENILQAGTTTLSTGSTGPPPPPGLGLGIPPVYYDLATTAVFSGTVQVCINYAGVAFANPSAIRLFHFEGGAWVDRTVSLDSANTTICAAVTSLSPFAIFQPADTVPPITNASISPLPNDAGWNNSNVEVTLSATDNEPGGSGVKQITFSATGSQPIPATSVSGASASFSINTEGITTVSFSAVDRAGNVEASHTLTIKVDKTPPVLSGLPSSDCALWPPNRKFVTVTTISGADALSGVASLSVTGVSNEPMDPANPDILIAGTGVQPRTIQLRAERQGSGTGRIYALTTTAIDQACNTATTASTCAVPHDQGP